jgi:hypothetical protein
MRTRMLVAIALSTANVSPIDDGYLVFARLTGGSA